MLNNTQTELAKGSSSNPSETYGRFDLVAEAETLRHQSQWRDAGHNAKTLLRQSELRVVLIVLKAGARLHEHKTNHRITVQTLSGCVQLNLPDTAIDLPAAAMLALGEGIPHDVVAKEDSTILLTICWVPTSIERQQEEGT